MAELVPWQVLSSDLRSHRDAVANDWVRLLDSGEGERACVKFLHEHAGFFFCDSGRRLLAISELELGADFRPDFVVATDMSSSGLVYEFIEIEDPNQNPFTLAGQPSARLNGAVNQIIGWDTWIRGNQQLAKKLLPSREFWTHDRLVVRYTIITGRRAQHEKWTHSRNLFSDRVDVQIRSFDHLTDELLERYFAPFPNLASVEMDNADEFVRNQLVNPFRRAISSAVWREAALKLHDDHMNAKNIDLLVSLASTSDRLAPFLQDWGSLPVEKRSFYINQLKFIQNL